VGWILLGVVWLLAIFGVIMKMRRGVRNRVLSTALYIGMGWLVVVAARPLLMNVPTNGLLLLLAGGIAYTGGVVFYLAKHVPYCHFVWHLFVLAGTTFHYLAVFWYAATPVMK
jgi:hemolysin III